MKAKSLVAVTALALTTGAVVAQEAGPLNRAEVKQQVLDARAAGTLAHAGETGLGETTAYKAQVRAPSTLTRAQAKANVLYARAAGELAHAGAVAPEEEMLYARAHPSTSTLTRAEVREQVLEARAGGALIPAGEGGFAPRGYTHPAFAKSVAGENVASIRK